MTITIYLFTEIGISDALFCHLRKYLRVESELAIENGILDSSRHPSFINQVYKSRFTLHAKNVRVIDDILLRVALFCTRSRCITSICGLPEVSVW
jgi:hypothetical protein